MDKVHKGFILMSVIVVLNVILMLILANQQLIVRNWQRLGRYQQMSQAHYALLAQAQQTVAKAFDTQWLCVYPVSYFGRLEFQAIEQAGWCHNDSYQWYIEKAPFDCCLREQRNKQQLLDEYHLVIRQAKGVPLLHVLFTKPSVYQACECPSPFVITEHILSYQWGK